MNALKKKTQIFVGVCKIIKPLLPHDFEDEIVMDSDLEEDLWLNFVDKAEIYMGAEDKFGVKFPEEKTKEYSDIMKSVNTLVDFIYEEQQKKLN